MDPRVITLVRHGAIEQADDQRRYVGQLDVPLSAEGVRQAGQLQRRFARTPFQTIVSSDLSRTRQMAEIIAKGRPVTLRADLREIAMGDWEGATFRGIATQYPEAYRARGEDLANYRVPRGESFADCSARVVAAFEQLLITTEGPLLLVGHAGPNRLILCHLLGMPIAHLFRISQDYGCLNVVHCVSGGFQVRLVNGRGTDARG